MKRILVCLLALCMLATLVSCGKKEKEPMTDRDTAAEETKTDAVQTKETQAEEKTEEGVPAEKAYTKAYGELTEDFKKLLTFGADGTLSENWYDELIKTDFSDTAKAIAAEYSREDFTAQFEGAMTELFTSDEKSAEKFGTVEYDLNKDGTPELFWVKADHSIVALFTYGEGGAKLLDAFWSRYKGFVSEKGVLYSWGSSGARNDRCSILQSGANGEWIVKEGFSSEPDLFGDPTKTNYFEFSDSQKKRITASRFEELSKEYPPKHSSLWTALAIQPLQ